MSSYIPLFSTRESYAWIRYQTSALWDSTATYSCFHILGKDGFPWLFCFREESKKKKKKEQLMLPLLSVWIVAFSSSWRVVVLKIQGAQIHDSSAHWKAEQPWTGLYKVLRETTARKEAVTGALPWTREREVTLSLQWAKVHYQLFYPQGSAAHPQPLCLYLPAPQPGAARVEQLPYSHFLFEMLIE